jgi:colanic acid/amylovoran biosynthesis glycosyltransferase
MSSPPSVASSAPRRPHARRRGTQLTVVHRSPIWLARTEAWLHEQITALPDWIESRVVADRVRDLELFPVDELASLSAEPLPRQLWDAGLRKLRIRRHSGFLDEHADGADVLHSHFGPDGWADAPVARRRRLPHIVSFYGYDANRLPRENARWLARYRDLFRTVDRVLCEGPALAESVVGLGCPSDKVRVHHLGVRVASLRYAPRTYAAGSTLRVLMASGFREKKGLPYGVEALAKVAEQVPVELTIIGGSDGTAEGELEARRIRDAVERYRLTPVVTFRGMVTHAELVDELYRHHVYLAPSIRASNGDAEGGAPVTIILAAATGMPVISTRHCDIPYVLRDGVPLLAEERDIAGLAQAFEWLLDRPWDGFLQQIYTRIAAEYDSAKLGLALARHYEELAS